MSWLLSGTIGHRDSAGTHTLVRPGEVNLMTSGHGVAHSEVSMGQREALHGAQLWVALPWESADLSRAFQHHVPDVDAPAPGVRARAFIGSLADQTSPIQTQTPLLGAEVVLDPGVQWEMAVDAGFEHGVLVDEGTVDVDGVRVDRSVLGVRDAGLGHLRLHNPSDEPVRGGSAVARRPFAATIPQAGARRRGGSGRGRCR